MEVEEIKRVRIDKLNHLKASDLNPFGGKFNLTTSIFKALNPFEEGKEVVMAGRIMANRSHGKVFFWI